MPHYLPPFVPLVFGSTIFAILGYFFSLLLSTRKGWKSSVLIFAMMIVWLSLQAVLSIRSFYTVTDSVPPRFLLMFLPPLILIFSLFISKMGRNWMDQIPLEGLTYLHSVRIPIELVLYWLAFYGWVPVSMTFAGWNFDIVAGLTAPIVAYFLLRNSPTFTKWILIWNFLSLALLLNIIGIAILSAPGTLQKLSFESPNIAIFHFPYVWLPSFAVPAVLFAHLVSIRRWIFLR